MSILKLEYEIDGTSVFSGNTMTAIGEMPKVDCVITDPPYWTLNKWREVGTTTRLGGHKDADKREGWFETIDSSDLWRLICTFGMILPKNAHAWVMCDDTTSDYLTTFVRQNPGGCPFTYCKRFPVIKLRADGQGYRPGMGYHGRATHEYVVLLERGRNRFKELGHTNWPDVFQIPWTGDAETRGLTPGGKPYPTAKPLSFFRQLIELSTLPGETVLDPFCGSGPVVAAAMVSGRKGVGVDSSPDAIATTIRRLESIRDAARQVRPAASLFDES